jgi:hypothetical protein
MPDSGSSRVSATGQPGIRDKQKENGPLCVQCGHRDKSLGQLPESTAMGLAGLRCRLVGNHSKGMCLLYSQYLNWVALLPEKVKSFAHEMASTAESGACKCGPGNLR